MKVADVLPVATVSEILVIYEYGFYGKDRRTYLSTAPDEGSR
jgi:hypothetical protein